MVNNMYHSNWISTIFFGCRSSQGLLKRGIENSVFWPEKGSGWEQPGGGYTPNTNSQEHPCKYSTSTAYHIYKCLKMCIVRFYSGEPASSCMVFCNFIRGVDQGLVCYFANVDAAQLLLFNEKKKISTTNFVFPPSFADTNTSLRRPQVSSGAHHRLLVSSMTWVDRMLSFFSFCNSQPGRVLPNYIYNERDPSISNFGGRMIDWFNWNEYFPGFICRCAEKAKLAGYDLIGVQFFGKKGNVTKCYHNYVLSLTTTNTPPPPTPHAKKEQIYPFLN